MMREIIFTGAALLLLGSAAVRAGNAATPPAENAAAAPTASSADAGETGLAAVYSDRLNGHRTASGARYDRNKLTAAHKTLPFGTKVRVVNTKNGKLVEITINDRGPKQANRILDISPRAARELGIGRHAMAPVRIERIS